MIEAAFNNDDDPMPNWRCMHMALIPKGGATVPPPQSWPELRGTVLIYEESHSPDGCIAGNSTPWVIFNPYLPIGPLRWLTFRDDTGPRAKLMHLPGTGNLACTGHAWTDDGRLFIAGGNVLHGTTGSNDYASPPPPCILGGHHAYLFDPTQGTISSDQTPLLKTWAR